MAGPLPQFEVKLEPGDTRASLMEKKLRAEMSFRQVSEEYHVVWLNCRDHSKTIITELEELKSLNLNGKIAQPPAAGVANSSEAYLDWLYASLERLQDRFGQFLQQLSQATGVEVKHAPLKQKKRVLEKAFYDYQGDYSRLVDICRGSGVAEDLAGVVKAMKWVLGHCHVVRFKNRFCDGRRDIMARGGYRDILVNLELAGGAGGFVFELQIHLRPLFAMKEEAHKVLDLARAVIEPTLLKLSLLDAQESHAQLVHKIKQLEQQVSGLTIEAAVQGQQRQQVQQVADQDEEWKKKYQQLQKESQDNCARLQRQYEQKCAEAEQSQQKYTLQQKEHEKLQQTISQLKTDVNRRDAEIQALKLATSSKPVSEEKRPADNSFQDSAVLSGGPPKPAKPTFPDTPWHYVDVDGKQLGPSPPNELAALWQQGRVDETCLAWKESMADWTAIGDLPDLLAFFKLHPLAPKGWWQDSYITGLRPPSGVFHGEALLPRVSELTSKIKLQPDDAIIFAHFRSFIVDNTFAITRRELFNLARGWNILLSQIKECSLRTGSSTLVITMASGETKELLAYSNLAGFVKTVLMFAARGIKT